MKFILSALFLASSASAFAPAAMQGKVVTSLNSESGEASASSGVADLQALAKDLNPILNY
jgi:uncharacterized protein YraI